MVTFQEVSKLKPIHLHKGLGIWLTGTPRIGKSVFLFYVAAQFIQTGIRFVVTINNQHYEYVNKKFVLCEFSHMEKKYLSDPTIIHLIDPFSKTVICEHDAFAIFFASPSISNIHPYHRKNLQRMFMPLWSKEEMRDCYTVLQEKFDENLYDKWGGIFMDEYRSKVMQSELADLSLEMVLAVSKQALSLDVASYQWLIHRIPTDDYSSCETTLPSNYVRQEILKKLKTGVNFQLPIGSVDKLLFGEIYETAVFNYLVPGESIEVIPYHDDSSCSRKILTIQNVVKFCNNSVNDVILYGTLFIPVERNKRGLDAVFVDKTPYGWVIQVTVNPKHKTSINVSDINVQFPNVTSWNICCIYPPECKEFRFPSVVGVKAEKYIFNFLLIDEICKDAARD